MIDVVPSIIILLSIVVMLFVVLYQQKWELRPVTGYGLIGVYGIFVVYQIIRAAQPKSAEAACPVC